MKKAVYQRMYDCLSILSGRFNNKLLARIKIALGAALIVLTNSCNSGSDEPEVTCYIFVSPNDTVDVQSAPENSIEINETEFIEDI